MSKQESANATYASDMTAEHAKSRHCLVHLNRWSKHGCSCNEHVFMHSKKGLRMRFAHEKKRKFNSISQPAQAQRMISECE
jgi:hypothetical protein